MPCPRLRFATCTPVAFHANDYFYSRDTGLICRELQKLGHECRVIMPLPAHEDDLATSDLLRVERRKLYQSSWWRQLGIDAVVLYSWGDPRYTCIARAIRKAGLKLIIHFDSSGELHEHRQRPGCKIINKAKDALVNLLRRMHLNYAHIITTSRPCIEALQQDACYGSAIAGKCREFPNPVESCFCCHGQKKEPRIICVGSWHLPVKRAGMMMKTLAATLEQHSSACADICGSVSPALQDWHAALPTAIQARIHLHGLCSHEQLSQLFNAAFVSLCTSESEGSHGASAEALSCGCSIVCPPRHLLSVVQWYTGKDSGTVAAEDTPDALCEALLHELELWQQGKRNAAQIATTWQPCFRVSDLAGWLQE